MPSPSCATASCGSAPPTSATSPSRGRSWPACPRRCRWGRRSSTASWWRPTRPGRPSFGRLQQRMHVAVPAEAVRRAAEVPITYVVFDLLHLDGHSLLDQPLSDRRRLLHQVVDPGPWWRTSPVHDDGPALLAATDAQGLEGVVAKRDDSRYEPGRAGAHLAQGQGPAPPGGRRRGLAGRRGQPGRAGSGRCSSGVHERAGDGGPLRYAGRGRHRVHRTRAGPPGRAHPCPRHRRVPVRPPAAEGRPGSGRHLAASGAGGRGGLRRVDRTITASDTRATSACATTRTPPTSPGRPEAPRRGERGPAAGVAEPSVAPLGGRQRPRRVPVHLGDRLDDELGDAIASVDLEGRLGSRFTRSTLSSSR